MREIVLFVTSNSTLDLLSCLVQEYLPVAFPPFLHPSHIQRRTFLGRLFFGRKKEPKRFLDPLSPDHLKFKPVLDDQPPREGDLTDSPLFGDPSLKKGDVSSTYLSNPWDLHNMADALNLLLLFDSGRSER